METALTTLLEASPYLVVLIWVIIRQDRRLDTAEAHKQKLIDQLMLLHPPQSVDGAAKEKQKATPKEVA